MRPLYTLFQSHLDLAHQYWDRIVSPGDIIIDATCGNGLDTLKLAQLAITYEQGFVYACDIQANAVESARHYLEQHLPPQKLSRIQFVLGCHSEFPLEIQPESVKLIVYNFVFSLGIN